MSLTTSLQISSILILFKVLVYMVFPQEDPKEGFVGEEVVEREIGAEVVTWTDIDTATCNCGGIMDITRVVEDEEREV